MSAAFLIGISGIAFYFVSCIVLCTCLWSDVSGMMCGCVRILFKDVQIQTFYSWLSHLFQLENSFEFDNVKPYQKWLNSEKHIIFFIKHCTHLLIIKSVIKMLSGNHESEIAFHYCFFHFTVDLSFFSSPQGRRTLRQPHHSVRPAARAPGRLQHPQQHRLLPDRAGPSSYPGEGGQLPSPGQIHVCHHHQGKDSPGRPALETFSKEFIASGFFYLAKGSLRIELE